MRAAGRQGGEDLRARVASGRERLLLAVMQARGVQERALGLAQRRFPSQVCEHAADLPQRCRLDARRGNEEASLDHCATGGVRAAAAAIQWPNLKLDSGAKQRDSAPSARLPPLTNMCKIVRKRLVQAPVCAEQAERATARRGGVLSPRRQL